MTMTNGPESLRNRGKNDRRQADEGSERDNYESIELHDMSQPTRHEDMETIVSTPSQNRPTQQPQPPQDQQHELDIENLPFIYKHTSVLLENKGSVARDHLANERTFLAWVRTGSVFVTLGITFIQFVHLAEKSTSVTINGHQYDLGEFNSAVESVFAKYAKVIEIMALILGVLAVLFAGIRYLHVQTMLTRDYFPVSRFKVVLIMAINLAMVILLIILDVRLYK